MRLNVNVSLRVFAISVSLALGIGATQQVAAQLAPVSGAHYAARASDTGF